MADDLTQVISGLTYKNIATAYAKLKYRLDTAGDYLLDAVNYILDTDELVPNIDLLNDFYQTYFVHFESLSADTPWLGPVRKLNAHVLGRGGYASINAYLAAKSTSENGGVAIKVPQAWADLSAATGQTISSTYITTNSF
jgi:hypothetical protein